MTVKRSAVVTGCVFAAALALTVGYGQTPPASPGASIGDIRLPPGFTISVFASDSS